MDLVKLRGRLSELRLVRDLHANMRFRFIMVMMGISRNVVAREGHIIFRQGDAAGDDAYVLLTGQVEVTKEETPPITAMAPDIFGEIKQINPTGKRTATVVVNEESQLLQFEWSDFFEAAGAVFNTQEMAQLRQAFEQLAWSHVT